MIKTEIDNMNTGTRIKWEFGEPHFLYGYSKGEYAYTIQLGAPNHYPLFSNKSRHIADFKSLKDAKEYTERLTILTKSQRAMIAAKLVGKRLDQSKINSLMADAIASTRSRKLVEEPPSKELEKMLLSLVSQIDEILVHLC